jgi:replicative DNA helicase
MEFMSQGVPVVISRTKIDTFYFEEGVVHFFPSGDSEAMANAMLDVIHDKGLRASLVARGYEYVERNSWGRKKKEYLELIDSLSTERFDDVEPALRPPTKDCKNQQALDPLIHEIDDLAIQGKDTSSVSTLKGS